MLPTINGKSFLEVTAKVSSSGCVPGHEENYAVDENVQTWWKADIIKSGECKKLSGLKCAPTESL